MFTVVFYEVQSIWAQNIVLTYSHVCMVSY